MLYNELFSRATMFLTLLSATVVALALVAQATAFGPQFHLFALLVLPVVLLMGVGTFIRLGDANTDNFGLVIGMNRLRHAYLDVAPELEPYFVAGHHDDRAGLMQTYGLGYQLSQHPLLASTPPVVAAINMVVAGVLGALSAEVLGASDTIRLAAGIVVALVAAVGHGGLAVRSIAHVRRAYQPRFPRDPQGQAST
jgi:hypothetical protein